MIDTLEYSVDAPIRSVEEPAFVHARYWIDVTLTCELSGNPVFFLGAIRYALRQGWSMIAVARDLFLVLVALASTFTWHGPSQNSSFHSSPSAGLTRPRPTTIKTPRMGHVLIASPLLRHYPLPKASLPFDDDRRSRARWAASPGCFA
jgi:hypothetical protein